MPPRKSNFSRRCQARPRNTPGPAPKNLVHFRLKSFSRTWLMQAVEETTPSLTVGTEPGGEVLHRLQDDREFSVKLSQRYIIKWFGMAVCSNWMQVKGKRKMRWLWEESWVQQFGGEENLGWKKVWLHWADHRPVAFLLYAHPAPIQHPASKLESNTKHNSVVSQNLCR